MVTQNLNTTIEEKKPLRVIDKSRPKMTMEELQASDDEILLEMVELAKGHTNSNDFKEHLWADFSYSFLTGELKNRHYVNGWYKVGDATVMPRPEVVTLRNTGGGDRLTLTVDTAVKTAWHNLTARVPYKKALAIAALSRFIDAVNAGRIKFEVDLTANSSTAPTAADPVSHGTRDDTTGDVETGGLPDGSV